MDGYADQKKIWDEEIQERVKIPVDETDSAEVVGSNPTGPTTNESATSGIIEYLLHLQKGRI